jgi:hypothetical protein
MSNETQTRPHPTAKKRPRGRPFTGRDDQRNRTNREAAVLAGEVPPAVPVEGEGILAALRHVLVNDRAHDRTPEQRLARLLLKDKAKFFDRLVGLEKAELLAKATARQPTDEVEEDLCSRQIERLLGEFYEQQAREDAELATRPDASKLGATLQNRLKCALERQQQLERQNSDLRERLLALGDPP